MQMGYPTAYRAAAQAMGYGRLSNPVALFVIPPKAPDMFMLPPSAFRQVAMREITQVRNSMPPLGLTDIRQFGRLARPLMKLHPLLRVLNLLWDALDAAEFWKEQQGGLNGWVQTCSTPPDYNAAGCSSCSSEGYCQPGPFWTAQGGGNCGLKGQNITPVAFPSGAQNVSGWASSAGCFYCGTPNFCSTRYMKISEYNNPNWPTPRPEPSPLSYAPRFMPRLPPGLARRPWISPEFLPIQQPVPDPLPPPYHRIPDRKPSPEHDVGNYPKPDLGPIPVTNPLARGAPPAGRVTPGPKVKEKKLKTNTVVNFIRSAVKISAQVHGKLADFRDLVKALHDSLPKELQLKGKDKKSIPKLLRRVYDHLDKMDSGEAIGNILKEIAEDLIGGAGDRLRQEAAQKMGWFKNKIYTSPRF